MRPRPRSEWASVQVPSYLIGGWSKVGIVLVGVVTYIVTAARWSAQIEDHFNMVAFQVGELDKRVSTQIAELSGRAARIEDIVTTARRRNEAADAEPTAQRRR